VEQLAPEGRLILPLGERGAQVLTLVKRQADSVVTRPLDDVRFVPLVGQFGFQA
jgi:protein-L-isoaspartate(D-aspartate) O-methyltransferase